MIVQNAFTKGSCLIEAILLKMSDTGVGEKKFILHILILVLRTREKINFLQLELYGSLSERTYRNNFSTPFDWFEFNKVFTEWHCSDEHILAFAPSFISKSGKCTPGIGCFYSSCRSRYGRGIEIGRYSVLDVKQNTSYHLCAEQTTSLPKNENQISLMDQYIE